MLDHGDELAPVGMGNIGLSSFTGVYVFLMYVG
jgi:hypothetical protein